MMIELTAARAMAPVFGTSIYTWTNVILVVLLALSLGYWWGGWLADRRPDATVLGKILIIAGLLSIPAPFLVIPLGDALLPAPTSLTPFWAQAHLERSSLVVTLALFAPPLIFMGMVGPFVVRLLVDSGLDGGRASGRALAVGTLGSLLGTWLPAHVLLDWLGVRQTLLAASVLLILVGAGLLLWRRAFRVSDGSAALLAILALLFAGGVPVRGVIGDFRQAYGAASDPLVEEELIHERESAYQYVRVSAFKRGEGRDVRLTLDEGITEFHSLLVPDQILTGAYYDSFALLPEMTGLPKKLSVAILGGGAGTMARLIRTFHDSRVERVLSVELDPAVGAMGPHFGWTPELPDRTVVADARVFLRHHSDLHDIIILDAYARQIAIPPHLASREFMELVASRLNPMGLFAINVSTPDFESPLARSLLNTVKTVFRSVALVSIPGSWNGVILARPEADASFGLTGEDDRLQQVRMDYRRGFYTAPDLGSGGMLLTDDRAPMEKLARVR
jgi:predicted membrane-bound spermidine synthase